MKEDKFDMTLAEEVGRSDGLTVPEGYFADFAARMEAMLPEREPERLPAPRTRWQMIRPYAYLAAMFAGIWCMLQMFNMMGGGSQGIISPDTNPVLAEAISDDQFMDDYYFMDIDELDFMDDLYASGVDVNSIR